MLTNLTLVKFHISSALLEVFGQILTSTGEKMANICKYCQLLTKTIFGKFHNSAVPQCSARPPRPRTERKVSDRRSGPNSLLPPTGGQVTPPRPSGEYTHYPYLQLTLRSYTPPPRLLTPTPHQTPCVIYLCLQNVAKCHSMEYTIASD